MERMLVTIIRNIQQMNAPYIPLVLCHTVQDGIHMFHAWSPLHYHIVENNNIDFHPMMNPEYSAFMARIHHHLQTLNVGIISLHTDFHCQIPVEQRTNTLFLTTIDHHLSSPLFFSPEIMNHYLSVQRDQFADSPHILNTLRLEMSTHALL
jgi:hypothetical protein